MSDADKTPVDRKTTLEMVLEKLDAVGADTKLAIVEAREAKGYACEAKDYARATNDLQLEMNEELKNLKRRVRIVEAVRAWPAVVALVALFLATVAFIRSW